MGGVILYKFQYLGIIFSLVIILSVFWLIRARMLKEKYSVVWLLIGLFLLTVSVFREILDWFSRLTGIEYPPSAFFAMLMACAFLLLLNISVSISALKTQNKTLAQELGLLRLRLEELEKRLEKARL